MNGRTNGEEYPDRPLYRFDVGAKEPAPEYCEQPLLYTLVVFIKVGGADKNKKSRIAR